MKTPLEKDVEKEAGYFGVLAALAESPQGEILVKELMKSVVGRIDVLVNSFTTETDIKIRSEIAHIAAELTMLKKIARARKNFDISSVYLNEIVEE